MKYSVLCLSIIIGWFVLNHTVKKIRYFDLRYAAGWKYSGFLTSWKRNPSDFKEPFSIPTSFLVTLLVSRISLFYRDIMIPSLYLWKCRASRTDEPVLVSKWRKGQGHQQSCKNKIPPGWRYHHHINCFHCLHTYNAYTAYNAYTV